jgi:Domain of unknown function (DUF4747)
MARKKKVEVAAVNVRIHPHPPGIYRQFLRDAFALRRAVRVRGDTYMILGSLDTGDDEQDMLQGTLIKFTQIDPDAPWFNLETFAEAQEEQLGAIRIPENLRPNMVSMYFAFSIPHHLFIFERYSDGKVLSARQATRFLEHFFNDECLREKYGRPERWVAPLRSRTGAPCAAVLGPPCDAVVGAGVGPLRLPQRSGRPRSGEPALPPSSHLLPKADDAARLFLDAPAGQRQLGAGPAHARRDLE